MQVKKKILFFLPSTVGGAERMCITIGRSLDRESYEVKFVIVSRTKGNIIDFIPDEYEIIHLRVRTIWDLATLRIYRLLRMERPEVVFATHMYLNPRVIMAAACVGNIRTIVRNDNYLSTIGCLKKWMCKQTYRLADRIIAQQEEMKADIVSELKVNPSCVTVLHNPLDVKRIEDSLRHVDSPFPKNGSQNFLWVARFDRTKGQDILARAFVELYRRNKNVHLYYVGDFRHNMTYFNYVKKCFTKEIESHVHYIGFDTNPYRWIKYCDCFVLPSRIEGLPNTLIEAQYLGKPCVATRCIPIIDRIITNGVNGYTVPVDDYLSMANAMQKCCQMKDVVMTYQPANPLEIAKLFQQG